MRTRKAKKVRRLRRLQPCGLPLPARAAPGVHSWRFCGIKAFEFPTEVGTAHFIRRGEGNACMTFPIRQPGRLTAGLFERPHGRSVTPPAPCVQQISLTLRISPAAFSRPFRPLHAWRVLPYPIGACPALAQAAQRRPSPYASALREVRLHRANTRVTRPGKGGLPAGGAGGSGERAPEVPAQKVRLNFLSTAVRNGTSSNFSEGVNRVQPAAQTSILSTGMCSRLHTAYAGFLSLFAQK